ncbi:NAD(P)-dependent oxidoreductase [Mesorhizobium sp. LHD-90]|uniref:NAD(P)-dependent oxidoreductase n=1 Tax=Mesorhizobium sp. LHD-90 TaxID=3071414 RepID=UPI0027DFCE89|nr:NAD(P)-dependent oxidoreductase [Mesorhizobium sp. LHD-90]MDQ6432527.1 NAD(P)-dependent oxidoreductase [Mesorhizobium sp. LHD-90]
MATKHNPILLYAYDPSQRARFEAHESAPQLRENAPGVPVWQPPADADAIVCFLSSWARAPKKAPEGWPFNIRYIQFASAGVDTLPEWARSVPHVASARGITAEPIADYVMAAILGDCKKLDLLAALLRAGDKPFDETKWPKDSMRSIKSQTLGLVGYGAIGQAIARRAEAFGMEVIAVRRSAPDGSARFVDSIEQLAACADQIVLCAPATADTHRMVDDRFLSLVNPTAHLINVARGALVDHDALLRALDTGRLRHATLDVTDPEPLPLAHPLAHHPKATVTPHAAWYSPDHFDRVTTKLLDNLRRYANGEPLVDTADFARGY